MAAGVDPCETLVQFGADLGIEPPFLRAACGWTRAAGGLLTVEANGAMAVNPIGLVPVGDLRAAAKRAG